MRILTKNVLVITSLLLFSSVIGGCRYQPVTSTPHIRAIQVSGYSVLKKPYGISTIYNNDTHPNNKIIIEFNTEVLLDQNTPLLYIQGGRPIFIYPAHLNKEDVYDIYSVEEKKIVITALKGGLPQGFVALLLPKELKMLDGRSLDTDLVLWLSSSFPSPQIQAAFMIQPSSDHMSLVIPVFGGDNNNYIAYVTKETSMYSAPDRSSIVLQTLYRGENVEKLGNPQNGWQKVNVYYNKVNYNDKSLSLLPENYNIYSSNLVDKVEGYVFAEDIQIIPRPQNKSSFVTIERNNSLWEIEAHVNYNAYPAGGSSEVLYEGISLTREHLEYLEISALLWHDYFTAGRLYQTLPANKENPDTTLKLNDAKAHFPQAIWTTEEEDIFNRLWEQYKKEVIEEYLSYQVSEHYEDWKKQIYDVLLKRFQLQEFWLRWSRLDPELNVETFLELVGGLITDYDKRENWVETFLKAEDYTEPMIELINNHIVNRELIDKIIEEGEKIFSQSQ